MKNKHKIYILIFSFIITSQSSYAVTVVGKRSDHNKLISGLPFCEIGIGATKSEAIEDFKEKFHGSPLRYKIEAVCESGWAAIISTKGGSDDYACGWSCGAKSREAAEQGAMEACKNMGGYDTCNTGWSYKDNGNGLVETWRDNEIWWKAD